MVRYALLVAIVIGSAAIAAAEPGPQPVATPSHNFTIIEKNGAFPILGTVTFERCTTEDCSDAG